MTARHDRGGSPDVSEFRSKGARGDSIGDLPIDDILR
jgi:hypothetical protein